MCEYIEPTVEVMCDTCHLRFDIPRWQFEEDIQFEALFTCGECSVIDDLIQHPMVDVPEEYRTESEATDANVQATHSRGVSETHSE